MDEESWLNAMYRPSRDDALDADWRAWLHNVFVFRGALTDAQVHDLARQAKQDGAVQACERLTRDVRATLGESIEASASSDDVTVRVFVDGQMVTPAGLFSIGLEALAAEVADAIQEEVMDDRRVWPECRSHDAGLHPDLWEGRASWVCRVGDHPVAPIGHLL